MPSSFSHYEKFLEFQKTLRNLKKNNFLNKKFFETQKESTKEILKKIILNDKKNPPEIIKGKIAFLLWKIQKQSENTENILQSIHSYGIETIEYGWVCIYPADDSMKTWEVFLSPIGEKKAEQFHSQPPETF